MSDFKFNPYKVRSKVVLYDSRCFKLEDVHNVVGRQHGDNMKCYPSYKSSDPNEELNDFLQSASGCLITSYDLFNTIRCEPLTLHVEDYFDEHLMLHVEELKEW